MSTLWLVRHAPTRDNLDGIVMGQRDPEATTEGLSEGAGLLADVSFELAVSSDARRARATARAITASAPLRVDPRLRERSFGDWEGCDKGALQAAHPGAFTAVGSFRLDADPPGGEPLAALLVRVHAALSELPESGGPVLVVAHNGSLRAALALLGETDLATAMAISLDYLSPIAADSGKLRSPDALHPGSREDLLAELRAAPPAGDGVPSGATLVRDGRAERDRRA